MKLFVTTCVDDHVYWGQKLSEVLFSSPGKTQTSPLPSRSYPVIYQDFQQTLFDGTSKVVFFHAFLRPMSTDDYSCWKPGFQHLESTKGSVSCRYGINMGERHEFGPRGL